MVFSVCVLCLGAVVGIMALWDQLLSEVTTPVGVSAGEVVLKVPDATDPQRFVDVLQDEGLVRESPFIAFYLDHMKLDRPLVPGEYRLSGGASLLQLLQVVESGRVVTHTVVVRVGQSSRRVAQTLAKDGLVDVEEFLAVVRDPGMARALGVPAERLDGFLYPDVYDFRQGLAAETIVRRMVERFYESVPTEWLERLEQQGRGVRDFVRVAARVQEAPVPTKEWPLYASLLWRRLELGQSLDPDPRRLGRATVLFGPSDRRRVDQRWVPCNPGLEALRAASRSPSMRPRYLVRSSEGSSVYCADIDCYYDAIGRRLRPSIPPEPLQVP